MVKMMMRLPMSLWLRFNQIYTRLSYDSILNTGKKITVQACHIEMVTRWLDEKESKLVSVADIKNGGTGEDVKRSLATYLSINQAKAREISHCKKYFGTRNPTPEQKKQQAVIVLSQKAANEEIDLDTMKEKLTLIQDGKTYEAYY